MVRVVESFHASGGGRVFRINKVEEIHHAPDGRAEPMGTPTLMTDDGLFVEPGEVAGEYLLPRLGLIVREVRAARPRVRRPDLLAPAATLL